MQGDVPANILQTVSLGLIPNSGDRDAAAASKVVGEVYVEILHVPFIPLEVEATIDMEEVERLQRLVPPHWRLPKPGVLAVVLLRCTNLAAPEGFSKANPMVQISLCNGAIALQTKVRSS